jgi:hypothetical protein
MLTYLISPPKTRFLLLYTRCCRIALLSRLPTQHPPLSLRFWCRGAVCFAIQLPSVVSLSAYLNCHFQLPPCDSGDVRAHVQYGAAIFTPLSFEGGLLCLAALSYCILTPVPETRVEGIAHVDPHLMYARPLLLMFSSLSFPT